MRKSVKSMLSAGDVRIAGCLLQFELGLEILFRLF